MHWFPARRLLNPLLTPLHRRLIVTSPVRRDIFKIQDEADFNEKVLKSKEPVVVDFFAT